MSGLGVITRGEGLAQGVDERGHVRVIVLEANDGVGHGPHL